MTGTVKSFRLYKPKSKLIPVTRFVGDYTEEERLHFCEVFGLDAQRYRIYSRKSWLVEVMAFVVWMVSIYFFPRVGLAWICALLFAGLLGLVIYGAHSQPTLECPACHNRVDSRELGRYCPECGSGNLEPGVWLCPPTCRVCGKTMYRGKGRRYKIRACTHCGVGLDDKGV